MVGGFFFPGSLQSRWPTLKNSMRSQIPSDEKHIIKGMRIQFEDSQNVFMLFEACKEN